VAEWLKAAASKAVEVVFASVSSNLTLSARKIDFINFHPWPVAIGLWPNDDIMFLITLPKAKSQQPTVFYANKIKERCPSWLKEHDWKSCVLSQAAPRVRIPLSPPFI
jgi:hypothetical protein